jgi:hypothetical protein
MSPGSVTAIAHGCRCSPEMNVYGLGYGCASDAPLQYLIALLCPIHGAQARGWLRPRPEEIACDAPVENNIRRSMVA